MQNRPQQSRPQALHKETGDLPSYWKPSPGNEGDSLHLVPRARDLLGKNRPKRSQILGTSLHHYLILSPSVVASLQ
jgi:hypothetical protein